MQAQITPWGSSKAIGITFTDKPVIAFGGLALFVAFARQIGLAPTLAEALSFVLTFQPFAPGLEVSGSCFTGGSGLARGGSSSSGRNWRSVPTPVAERWCGFPAAV